MTAEERGYPMEKELFDYVAERAEVLATNDASTQATKDGVASIDGQRLGIEVGGIEDGGER